MAKVFLDDKILVFGPLERVLTDVGNNLLSEVVKTLFGQLDFKRLKTYPWHQQENGTVERWTRTIAKDLERIMATEESACGEHFALL